MPQQAALTCWDGLAVLEPLDLHSRISNRCHGCLEVGLAPLDKIEVSQRVGEPRGLSGSLFFLAAHLVVSALYVAKEYHLGLWVLPARGTRMSQKLTCMSNDQ